MSKQKNKSDFRAKSMTELRRTAGTRTSVLVVEVRASAAEKVLTFNIGTTKTSKEIKPVM